MKIRKHLIIASLGTLLEYYDYALVAIFLPVMAPFFFAKSSSYNALVKGYWIFMIAMIARPVGGLLFGYIGDWLGRRIALLISIIGISVSTLAVGILPGYADIGVWAAVLLTIFKSIQLFCFGGEYNGAGIYAVEHANGKSESSQGSYLTAMTLGGGLLATLAGVALTHPNLPVQAWRLAYIIGAIIGFIAIIYRNKLKESPSFEPANLKIHTVKYIFKNYKPQLIACFFIGGFSTLSFTTVITFINPVLMTTGYMSAHAMMWLQTYLVIVAIIALIFSGHAGDKHSPYKVMLIGSVMLATLAFPLMWLVSTKVMLLVIIAQTILIICNETLLGPANAYLKNCFPTELRYRGVSLAFCSGMSAVAGLTPLIENALYRHFGSFAAIAIWVSLISTMTILSLRCAKNKS